tara:strand:- start:173 stop:679 length:507 start_codon:yes stop_codon:yes gene_type:complete
MGLIQVATNTVSSPTAQVTLTGIDSDDVYMVAMNNVVPETNSRNLKSRVTKSGTADTTSNYDVAGKQYRTDTTFSNSSSTNSDNWLIHFNQGNLTGEANNIIYYLYNFNSSSEYSFITFEETGFDSTPKLVGNQGGAVHTVASASDGVHFYMSAGNIASGTFTLYKVT